MTLSTSAVAVCCSSDSVSSRVRCCSASNSRTFSIAITAWSAKVVTSSICLSVNGRRWCVSDDHADRRAFTQQRDAKHSAETAQVSLPPAVVFRIRQNIGDVNGPTFEHDSADERTALELQWLTGL